MITDTEIKIQGFHVLTEYLGEIGLERFISLIQREPFDYTKWQRELWSDKSVEELSAEAMNFRRQIGNKG